MTDKIPEEVLKAAHLKLCRSVAASITRAMVNSPLTIEEICVKLEWVPADFYEYMGMLMNGEVRELRILSDMCCALDREAIIDIIK